MSAVDRRATPFYHTVDSFTHVSLGWDVQRIGGDNLSRYREPVRLLEGDDLCRFDMTVNSRQDGVSVDQLDGR